jgi:hypothetical protein
MRVDISSSRSTTHAMGVGVKKDEWLKEGGEKGGGGGGGGGKICTILWFIGWLGD